LTGDQLNRNADAVDEAKKIPAWWKKRGNLPAGIIEGGRKAESAENEKECVFVRFSKWKIDFSLDFFGKNPWATLLFTFLKKIENLVNTDTISPFSVRLNIPIN
jgi:hypothetical protein